MSREQGWGIHGQDRSESVLVDAARLHRTFDFVPLALVLVGREQRITAVNPAAERLFGYTRQELVGASIDLLLPESSRSVHATAVRAFLDAPQHRTMGPGLELFGRRKNGEVVAVEIALTPLDTPLGLETLACVLDVTERKRAYEERARLAAIVESSGDAIIGRDLNGVVTSWNGGAARMFGYTPEEMIGRDLSCLLPVDGTAQGTDPDETRAAEEIHHFQAVRRRKDGQLIHVLVTISPIRDSFGKLIGTSKTSRDITSIKAAEAALTRAKLAADAANRELESFSYSVAHDLRAPLRSIDGFSEALLQDYSATLDEEGRRFLRHVRESAQHMAHLIDDLLALSGVMRAPLLQEAVDLSAVARGVVARLRRDAPEREVEVSVAEGMRAVGDARLLGVAMSNLLENAWKFTGKRADAKVEIGCLKDGARTVYFVRDNGAGFDMAYAHKLFGVFQRLHSVRDFPGTGIGLATVQRVVHRHHGRVWADARVGEGATFFFTLASETPT